MPPKKSAKSTKSASTKRKSTNSKVTKKSERAGKLFKEREQEERYIAYLQMIQTFLISMLPTAILFAQMHSQRVLRISVRLQTNGKGAIIEQHHLIMTAQLTPALQLQRDKSQPQKVQVKNDHCQLIVHL